MKRRRHARGDRAEIQRFRTTQIHGIATNTRAALPCGCCIFVGLDETRRATTGAQPCSAEHVVVTERASALLTEVLATPRHRLLVETCRIALSQAAREIGL